MAITVDLTSFDGSDDIRSSFDFPDTCPVCNQGVKPHFHYGIYSSGYNTINSQLLFTCSRRNCYSMFISYYKQTIYMGQHGDNVLQNLKPKTFMGKDFGLDILSLKDNINTRFFDIYKEAEQAEQMGLLAICGGGYRRALEFLIKEYAIYLNPEDESIISDTKFTLSQCITRYMPSDSTQTFSTLLAWLGNDEVHFTRKHDKDIAFMKPMISALLSSINNDILLKKAKEIVNPTISDGGDTPINQ